ncbi:C-X-C motif chemokine 2-like [Brienomyrus brachyistius]|uniref:C-X-C motif chemokine 2-like n=1 Tax=Brienomyrus brachyistius TaxID=42636 RepID=UPI0020B1D603|nr:C-X-C motif chemokine 2-like [Brienomyrus brachyistius]
MTHSNKLPDNAERGTARFLKHQHAHLYSSSLQQTIMNTRKSSIMLFFCLSFLVLAEGQSISSAALYCRCITKRPMVQEKRIRRLEVFPPGPHCSHTEIIVTLGNMQRLCLNPMDKNVESYINRVMRKK